MRAVYSLLLAVCCVAPVLAQLASGPDAGSAVQPVKVAVLTGPQEGKDVEYAAERKDKPTLYVFLREFDRPVARYLKHLDLAIREESTEAFTVAVWLTEKQDETRTYLPRVQQSLKMESTALTLFTRDVNGPDNWNLNPNVRVTTVLVNGGKVVKTFAYQSINDTDVPAVREALKKAIAK
jgi:hypothetical protein